MFVFESPEGPLDVPAWSITEAVLQGLALRGDAPAVIEGPTGRSLSGTELAHQIRAFAGGVTQAGLAPGRVVALLAPNVPEFVVAFHGVAFAGGTVTPINPSYTAEEVNQQLRDSGAVFLITIPALADVAVRVGVAADAAVDVGVAVGAVVTVAGMAVAASAVAVAVAAPVTT